MTVPHPIPYQGSKRHLAQAIIAYFPHDTTRLIEPFAGSAAVSLATAYHNKASTFLLNDQNEALINLWERIIDTPDQIASAYEQLWSDQQGRERAFYDLIRNRFNETQCPECLLYLLARCVKASVRYNAKGEFNQSPDNRRKGARPSTMRFHIREASKLLKGKTALASTDYEAVVKQTTSSDIVYMDPPYQGVCGARDPRYIGGGFSYDRFVEVLHALNQKGIAFIVSYDGRTGAKKFGTPLPDFLNLKHVELNAGRSSQATLLGRSDHTVESLYLSPSLAARLNIPPSPAPSPTRREGERPRLQAPPSAWGRGWGGGSPTPSLNEELPTKVSTHHQLSPKFQRGSLGASDKFKEQAEQSNKPLAIYAKELIQRYFEND